MLTAYVHAEITCDAPATKQGHLCGAQMEFTTDTTIKDARKRMKQAAWNNGWQSTDDKWFCSKHATQPTPTGPGGASPTTDTPEKASRD